MDINLGRVCVLPATKEVVEHESRRVQLSISRQFSRTASHKQGDSATLGGL